MRLASRPARMKTHNLLLSLFLISCGVDSDDETDSPLDINPSAGVTVSINFNAPPALVMVREGVNGPWRAAVQRSLTSYETNVRRPYTVMGVCDDGVVSSIQLEARTPSDERTINFSCVSWVETPPHGIFGSMVQPGAVTVDGVRRFSPASSRAGPS